MSQNGLIYGPAIQESGPNFFMEEGGSDRYEIDLYNEDEEGAREQDYDGDGYVDTETGEILE